MASQKIVYADSYKFDIDSEIARGEIVYKLQASLKQADPNSITVNIDKNYFIYSNYI